MSLKVLHVAASDLDGGAARAAYRIHRSLVENGHSDGIESRMRVLHKLSDDPTVANGRPTGESALRRRLRPRLTSRQYKWFRSCRTGLHSVAWPATGLGSELLRDDADLLHLHWLGNNTLSIEEIGQLRHTVIWTLHDQWAFCGAEHYATGPSDTAERFIEGYERRNRPACESGPDLNRRIWSRKRRAWRRPMQIVCPSEWLASCARRSALMRDWPITVIPYPIDPQIWARLDQGDARKQLALPANKHLVLFGAAGDTGSFRKGADLLVEALEAIELSRSNHRHNLELVVFGEGPPPQALNRSFPVRCLGKLSDVRLRAAYAAVDLVSVPSRLDNLPNIALEAQACGTPVVAFRIGGLPEIVTHRQTGWLARPFDTNDFAQGISWILTDENIRQRLSQAARANAIKKFSPTSVAGLYARLYRDALKHEIQR